MLIHELTVAGRRMLMPRRKCRLVCPPSDRARLGRPSLPNAAGLPRNRGHRRGRLTGLFGSQCMIKAANQSRSGVRVARMRRS